MYITASFFVLLIFSILYLSVTPGCKYEFEQIDTKTTASLSVCKNLIRDYLLCQKRKNHWLVPISKPKVQQVLDSLGSVDSFEKLLCAWNLLPNTSEGFDPFKKKVIKTPIQLTGLHPELGNIRWWWLLGTFPGKAASFIIYIMQIDICSPSIRKLYNLNRGETSIYFVSAGYGTTATNWVYSPFKAVQGTLTNESFSVFSFQSTDGTVLFESDRVGHFQGGYIWDDSHSLEFEATSVIDPSFDVDNGTLSLGGAGTLYSSYTNMNIDAKLGSDIFTGGWGWLDCEYGGAPTTNPGFLITENMVNLMTRNPSSGTVFPPYLWMVLRLKDCEYMLWVLGVKTPVRAGDHYNLIFNRYRRFNGNKMMALGATATVVKTQNIEGTAFITDVLLKIPGESDILLRSDAYGAHITIDCTNNAHYTSSVEATDSKGLSIGLGFIECNRFGTTEETLLNTLKPLGWEDKYDTFIVQKNSFAESLPSYLASIFLFLLVAFLLINLF